MKTYQISSFLLLVLCFSASFASANAKNEYLKTFSQQYNVNPDVEIKTGTSFGDVTLESWDNNEVSIEVEVTVDARSESEANKVFDRIDIKLHGSKERVTIESELNGHNENSEFEINIRIKAPENAILDLKHAFGNLKIGTFRNEAEINCSYGELTVQNLSHPKLDIQMSFGEATMTHAGGGEFTVEFGAMEINHLHMSAEVKCSYSSMEINVEGTKCTDLEIDNEFGNVDLELPETMSYRVEGHASFGEVELPNNVKNKKIEKDFSSYNIEGTIGQNPDGELVIKSSFGSVTVDFR